jgi:hypothetical protein
VVHRHDDGLLRIAVHDPFQTDFLSSHSNNNNSSPCIHTVLCKPEGVINTRNTGNNTRNKMQRRMRRTRLRRKRR